MPHPPWGGAKLKGPVGTDGPLNLPIAILKPWLFQVGGPSQTNAVDLSTLLLLDSKQAILFVITLLAQLEESHGSWKLFFSINGR